MDQQTYGIDSENCYRLPVPNKLNVLFSC